MDDIGRRYYRMGMACYFLSGICAISISIVVSLLQDHYHLSYGFIVDIARKLHPMRDKTHPCFIDTL